MGGWWAIRLDTGWGQLVNIIVTHIRPDHQHGDVAKMAQAHADQVRMLRARAHCRIPVLHLHLRKKARTKVKEGA